MSLLHAAQHLWRLRNHRRCHAPAADKCAGVTCYTPDINKCQIAPGKCDPVTGQCVYTAAPVGTPCGPPADGKCTAAQQCVGESFYCWQRGDGGMMHRMGQYSGANYLGLASSYANSLHGG